MKFTPPPPILGSAAMCRRALFTAAAVALLAGALFTLSPKASAQTVSPYLFAAGFEGSAAEPHAGRHNTIHFFQVDQPAHVRLYPANFASESDASGGVPDDDDILTYDQFSAAEFYIYRALGGGYGTGTTWWTDAAGTTALHRSSLSETNCKDTASSKYRCKITSAEWKTLAGDARTGTNIKAKPLDLWFKIPQADIDSDADGAQVRLLGRIWDTSPTPALTSRSSSSGHEKRRGAYYWSSTFDPAAFLFLKSIPATGQPCAHDLTRITGGHGAADWFFLNREKGRDSASTTGYESQYSNCAGLELLRAQSLAIGFTLLNSVAGTSSNALPAAQNHPLGLFLGRPSSYRVWRLRNMDVKSVTLSTDDGVLSHVYYCPVYRPRGAPDNFFDADSYPRARTQAGLGTCTMSGDLLNQQSVPGGDPGRSVGLDPSINFIPNNDAGATATITMTAVLDNPFSSADTTVTDTLTVDIADGTPPSMSAYLVRSEYDGKISLRVGNTRLNSARPTNDSYPIAAHPQGTHDPQTKLYLGGALYRDLAASNAVTISTTRGTISYGGRDCSSTSDGCELMLSRRQLREGVGATADTDPLSWFDFDYSPPAGNAGETTVTATVRHGGIYTYSANDGLAFSTSRRPTVCSDAERGCPPAELVPAHLTGTLTFNTVAYESTGLAAYLGAANVLAAGGSAALALGVESVAAAPSGAGLISTIARAGKALSHEDYASTRDSGYGRFVAGMEFEDRHSIPLADDAYLVIKGSAVWADNGSRTLRLGPGTDYPTLRCRNVDGLRAGAAVADDWICLVGRLVDGENALPVISANSDATGDVAIVANLSLAGGGGFEYAFGVAGEDGAYTDGNLPFVVPLPGVPTFTRVSFPIKSIVQVASTALTRADGSAAPVRTGDPVPLRLAVLNEDGGASAIGAISSITLTATSGLLASEYCQGDASSICTIPLDSGSALTAAATSRPQLVRAIPITLRGVDKAATATVSVTVVSTSGDDNVLRAEPLSVTFSGGAASIALTMNLPRLHNQADAADNADGAAANTDIIAIGASAADSRGIAATLPSAVTPAVIGPDGNAVSAGVTVGPNQHCGPPAEGKVASKCAYLVTATAASSAPLAAGIYKLRLSAAGVADAAESEFGVAGPAKTISIERDADELRLAEPFDAVIIVTDADGQPVADGTAVTVTASGRGSGAAAIQLISPAPNSDGESSASTRNGRVTVRFVVVGRDVATINAASGMASGVEVVDTRTVGTTAAEAESPAARLSSTAPNGFSSWSRAADADAATTAADLLAELDDVSFIWLWNGSRWLYYGEADGAPIPGSLNFNIIGVTEVLYLVGGG